MNCHHSVVDGDVQRPSERTGDTPTTWWNRGAESVFELEGELKTCRESVQFAGE